MISQNSILRERPVQIALIIIPFVLTGLIINLHDNLFVPSQAIDKSTIQWIDSQTECKWLKLYDNHLGVHSKWLKDASDNELIKKMQELNCK